MKKLFSASEEEIISGKTADIYFERTYKVLSSIGALNTPVVGEIFPRKSGYLGGVKEVLNLLEGKRVRIYSLEEGEYIEEKETIMRIEGPYGEFGIYETAILGILASSTGWVTAARECKEASNGKPVLSFGARHVHPAVASVMDRSAIIGGVDGVSSILGAELVGIIPSGTMPHALILIIGDTVEAARAFHKAHPDIPLVVLVDTFKDEAEEAIRVAREFRRSLYGIRLDTPGERGGVTPELVREVRSRLNQEGFDYVKIFVSGGLNPARIRALSEAGADVFGVGSYISGASPIDMTLDLKVVKGRPIAKRGRIPGITNNPRLRLVYNNLVPEAGVEPA
ncbi:MAG: nicotinate phosphoribosyltransferase [bacterium]|nr:nicotinate phosphoribosyltransferase [bacterium]